VVRRERVGAGVRLVGPGLRCMRGSLTGATAKRTPKRGWIEAARASENALKANVSESSFLALL
jgi:hypothetical protein